MHESFTDNTLTLSQLYALTIELFDDDERITRALDWVDDVLPVFVNACRLEVKSGRSDAIDRWLNWLDGESAQVIEEAGKGEVFSWRINWLRNLLIATRRLQQDNQWTGHEYRRRFAEESAALHRSSPNCFPLAYWYDLTDYLASAEVKTRADQHHAVVFPLVLSEPIVDGGTETNVLLAHFLLEPILPATGEVFLHPQQTVMRCMEDKFADSFQHAAAAARVDADPRQEILPGVRVRIVTVKPSHERFLCGIVLRGESGGGALAVGLRHIYAGLAQDASPLAVSFAVRKAPSAPVDGKCYPVGATDEKVRGCAKQGVNRLLVAKQQQSTLAMYGHKHDVKILGAATVKEAAQIAASAGFGRPPQQPTVETTSPRAASKKIVILFHRRAELDRTIIELLDAQLSARGHDVFIDRSMEVNIKWAQEIDRHILDADIVIALLSEASVASDMLATELQIADEARQKNGGRPQLLATWISYHGPLPERISYIVDPLDSVDWSAGEDNAFMESVFAVVEQDRVIPAISPGNFGVVSEPRATRYNAAESDYEPFDGLVPLASKFYIERSTDRPFLTAISQRHSIILVKGARQMGKSSLLARGLAYAEGIGLRTVLTDFQKLSVSDLSSTQAFYLALGRMLARQLKLDVALDDVWAERRSANLNFEEYVEDYVIPAAGGGLIWMMDEVDKLFFATNFSSDVFGLFRSWANERQGRVTSPWASLTMTIAYATEAHLFISDANQSPFNVGTRFEMRDFNISEVAELNARYGGPLKSDAQLRMFYSLVNGHPYLVRRGLYAIVTEMSDLAAFESMASSDNGPLGDHLRRILTLLARNTDNLAAVREVLRGKPCPTFESFYHLRSAGVLVGDSIQNASIRCNLYKTYLDRHLL